MSLRKEKVGSLLKEELSVLFQKNFGITEYGLITITDVIMSPDLKIAKVYVSIFGDSDRKNKTLSMLEAKKSFIRSMLGRSVHLRYTPEVFIFLDESLDNAMNLEKIFNQIHKNESKQND